MTDRGKFVSALCVQLASACMICALALIVSFNENATGLFYPLVLIPYALFAFLLNSLLLRRERTMRTLVLFNILLGILAMLAIYFVGGVTHWASLIIAAGIVAGLTVRSATLCFSPPELRSVMLMMELNLLVTVIFTMFSAVTGLPLIWSAPTVLGTAVSILGVMLYRSFGRTGKHGFAISALMFLAIFGAIWLLVGFAAAPAGGGIVWLWELITTSIKYVLSQIWNFILFLFSLIPQVELEGENQMEFMSAIIIEEQEIAEVNPAILAFIGVVGVAAIVISIVRLLIHLGKISIGGKRILKTKKGEKRDRPPFLKALSAFFARLFSSIKLRYRLWRGRNTPLGLLHILINRCRLSPWHKTAGETAREFLLRLRDTAESDESLYKAMDALILSVELQLYSGAREKATVDDSALIRRKIGAAVRRRYIQDKLNSVKLRLRRVGE